MSVIANDQEARIEPRLRAAVFWTGCAIAAFAILLFSVNVMSGLHIIEISDEWKYALTAQMLNQGSHLYRDVFSHHGPIPYMIAHLYATAIDQSDFSYIRVAQAILAIASVASLVMSPALTTGLSRLWAGATYLLFLSLVWNVQGFNLLFYWTISAYLFVIVITQLVAPILFGEAPTRAGLFSAGIAATIACFCAYSNVLATALLTLSAVVALLLSSGRQKLSSYARPFALGITAAVFAVGMWLWKFGDLYGFFIYHFYFNQQVYSEFINYSPAHVFRNFWLSLEPGVMVHSFSLILFAGWLCLFQSASTRCIAPMSWRDIARRVLPPVLVAFGILFVNPRGYVGPIVSCGFVGANFSLFAIAYAKVLEKSFATINASRRNLFYSLVAFAGVSFVAVQVSMHGSYALNIRRSELSLYESPMKPDRSPIYEFIRSITNKQGDFLAVNYNASIYIKLDRLPASGNVYYLPWQAAYNKRPRDGYNIDICADIETRRPSVIWFFNWRVWDRYSLDDYEPCVLSLIAERYEALRFDSPWYVRNDLWPAAVRNAPPDTGLQLEPWFVKKSASILKDTPILKPSAPLGSSSPVQIGMSPNHEERRAPLKRIGILLTTHGRHNSGRGELQLYGTETTFIQRFELSSLVDNEYYYFELKPGLYNAGQILSFGGESISTWESHLGFRYSKDTPSAYTCVIYEYVDGARRFTSGCPVP